MPYSRELSGYYEAGKLQPRGFSPTSYPKGTIRLDTSYVRQCKLSALAYRNSTMSPPDSCTIQGYLDHSTGISGRYEPVGARESKLAAEASS